jgi:hypothetical protein
MHVRGAVARRCLVTGQNEESNRWRCHTHREVIPRFMGQRFVVSFSLSYTDLSLTDDTSMQRVKLNREWTLFCPTDAKQLIGLFGLDFDEEYERLEALGVGKATMKARDLWKEVLLSLIESGGPFVMYKDSINGTLQMTSCTSSFIHRTHSLFRKKQREAPWNHHPRESVHRNCSEM